MKRAAAAAILAALLAVAFYYGTRQPVKKQEPARTETKPTTGAAAPSLSLVDLGGNRVESSSYAGRVVLVNFWAAWCTPCASEIPQLVDLQEKYRAQGLQILGISMEDRDSALREFYRKYKMNYPVVAGTAQTAEAFGGILGLPTTILIGREGRIRARYSGMADFAKLETEVAGLLHER